MNPIIQKLEKYVGKYITLSTISLVGEREDYIGIYNGVLQAIAGDSDYDEEIVGTMTTELGDEMFMLTKDNFIDLKIGTEVDEALFKIEHDIA